MRNAGRPCTGSWRARSSSPSWPCCSSCRWSRACSTGTGRTFFADINQRHPLSIAMAALRDEGALPLPSNIAGANKQLGPCSTSSSSAGSTSSPEAWPEAAARGLHAEPQRIPRSGQALFALADLDAGHGQWTQGLISLALDQGGMTLTNGGRAARCRPAGRRVAGLHGPRPQDLPWEPEQKNSERALDLLAGTQAHYCSLEGKGRSFSRFPATPISAPSPCDRPQSPDAANPARNRTASARALSPGHHPSCML
jgi:hypothetical protein